MTKGHLSFALDGEKLHGGWHLVRMHRRPGEKRDNWLLIKQHDEAERSASDKDILDAEPRSVVTGRTMDEITKGPKKEWRSNKTKTSSGKAAKTTVPKNKTKLRARAAEIRPIRKTAKSIALQNRPAGPKAPLPAFIAPCLATLSDKAPDSDIWLHEIKFDGYRIQARLDNGNAKLLTRKGLDWTKRFPTIAAAIAKLPKNAFAIGERVTVADFSMMAYLHYPGDETGYDFATSHPAVNAWLGRIAGLPGWKSAYDLLPGQRLKQYA